MARRIDSVADTIQRCCTISVFAAGHATALAENLRCNIGAHYRHAKNVQSGSNVVFVGPTGHADRGCLG